MLKSILRKLVPTASRLVPTALVQRLAGNFVPIFMLHRFEHPDYGIHGHSPERLRGHLEYFRREGYRAMTLQQLGDLLRNGETVPYRSAVFTIDDGFVDHHDIAGPLFAEYDIPLTCFLITGFIDGELWPWDDQLSYIMDTAPAGRYDVELESGRMSIELDRADSRHAALGRIREHLKRNDNSGLYAHIDNIAGQLSVGLPQQAPREHRPMSWDQANALAAAGHAVAAHTRSHRILSMLDDVAAHDEIQGSIERVRDKVAGAARVFAYPTGRRGDYTDRDMLLLEHLGITATVSTVSAPCMLDADYTQQNGSPCQDLPRFAMPDSLTDFIQYLGWIEYLKTRLRRH